VIPYTHNGWLGRGKPDSNSILNSRALENGGSRSRRVCSEGSRDPKKKVVKILSRRRKERKTRIRRFALLYGGGGKKNARKRRLIEHMAKNPQKSSG